MGWQRWGGRDRKDGIEDKSYKVDHCSSLKVLLTIGGKLNLADEGGFCCVLWDMESLPGLRGWGAYVHRDGADSVHLPQSLQLHPG